MTLDQKLEAAHLTWEDYQQLRQDEEDLAGREEEMSYGEEE